MSFEPKTITMTNCIKVGVILQRPTLATMPTVTTAINCLTSSTNRPMMASSLDYQEQISSYIQLLALMVGKLSFVPYDFSVLVLPLQAHLNLLKILHTTNLHLKNPALSVFDDTRRACT
jgi:hypothetical protein